MQRKNATLCHNVHVNMREGNDQAAAKSVNAGPAPPASAAVGLRFL
jgi:hypothetical protein